VVRHFTAGSVVALGVLGLGLAAGPPPETSVPPRPGQPAGRFGDTGAASCAAAGCHGRGGPAGSVGSEYSTWAERDPHRNAFAVLHDARSRSIQAARQAGPAERDGLCLACHTSARGDDGAASERSFGVSCEGCHGPAQGYLAAHYQDGWRALDRRQKWEGYGLYPTKSLAERARVCAGCHVGGAGAEVDHDLIAAGHPRLAFEYPAFHRLLPRHWRETQYGPDFEARAWAIGSVASAQAAVGLLEARAARAAGPGDRAWPELSEYGCFACHHDLGGPGRRGHGTIPWGTWYFPEAEAVARLTPFGSPPAGPGFADHLRGLMQSQSPRSEAVRDEAGRVARALDSWSAALQESADRDAAAGRQIDPGQVRAALDGLIGQALPGASAGPLAPTDWDRAAQHYLSVAALYSCLGQQGTRPRGPGLDDAVRAAAGPLRFPKGPGRWDSPRGFRPDDYRGTMGRLKTALSPTD
jgi:hypothetical protein